MAIYRGSGGSGSSTQDSYLNAVTEQSIIATTKAAEAAASASAASSSEAGVNTSATNAANSATAAANSATVSDTSKDTSVAQATVATTKASEASTSATNAATSASTASTQATNSTNSSTVAATSATNSANSATAAASSATTATTKASEASTSATTATTKASEAATSATNAATSATASATSASSISSSATTATTKAAEASTSADEAAASAASIGSSPTFAVTNMTIDATDLIVNDTTNLQTYLEGVDHSLFKSRATGVSTTYVSTVAIGGTTFAQPAVSGEISSIEGYFNINYTGATGVTVANLAATSTYVYIDKTGALQQQTTIPTRLDWCQKMFTMRIGVDTVAGTILGFEYLSNPIGHYSNSIRDIYTYLLAQGVPFKKDQTVTGRAGDLGFDVAAGSLMEFGGTGDIHNANIKNFNAVANTSYTLLSRTAIVSVGTDLVKYWDNAGTTTALGSTTVVGHRLFRYSDGAFAMQYGQGNYANMALAKAGVLQEDYVLNPLLKDATFFGWWLIESTATNTGGTTLTSFVEYTIGIQGGSSSGLSGALLKGNNGSDFNDAAATLENLGGVSKDSSTGAASMPTGTTAQRPTAATGLFRFNSTDTTFEGYNGTEWGPLAGGAAATLFPFYKANGTSDTIALTNAGFPFYKADGTQDNIGVS